jgi:hypothetical protein
MSTIDSGHDFSEAIIAIFKVNDFKQSVLADLQKKFRNYTFAVVFFLDIRELHEYQVTLIKLEKYLKNYNIPLMVFVGDPRVRLQAIKNYINPIVYMDKSEKSSQISVLASNVGCDVRYFDQSVIVESKISRQDKIWPGPVIDYSRLLTIYPLKR